MKLKIQRYIILVLTTLFFTVIGYVEYHSFVHSDYFDITDEFSILVNQDSLEVMESVPSPEFIEEIEKADDTGLLLGDRKKTVWYTSTIAPTRDRQNRVLEITFPLLEYINVWFYEQGKLTHHYRSGLLRPQPDRPIKANSFAFPIHDSIHDTTVVVAIKTSSLLNFEAQLWDRYKWEEVSVKDRIWHGFIIGIFVVLMGYSFLIGISLHNLSYVYYALFVLFMTGFILLLSGFISDLTSLRPENGRVMDPFIFGVVLFGTVFCNHFLEVKKWAKTALHFSYLIIVTSLIVMTLGYLSVTNQLLTMLSPILIITGFSYASYVALRAYLRGFERARFVLLSFMSILVGLLIYFSIVFNVISKGAAIHILEMATIISVMLLSVSLSEHINYIHNQKIVADKELIDMQKQFTNVVITTQEEERERFSATLHDGVGHGLLILRETIIKMHLKRKELEAQGKIPQELSDFMNDRYFDVKSQFDELIEDVRNLSHDLHPHVLKRLGLKAAIQSTFTKAFAETGIDWHIDIAVLCDVGDFSHRYDSTTLEEAVKSPIVFKNQQICFARQESEIIIYRIIQEAINNIIKYAKANEVLLRMYIEDNVLKIKIKDDGIGFQHESDKIGVGMNIMEGRIQLLGGWMDVKTELNRGVTLVFGVPINAQ